MVSKSHFGKESNKELEKITKNNWTWMLHEQKSAIAVFISFNVKHQ